METALQDRDRVGVHDAVLLDDFRNPEVFIDNLHKRFQRNLIYTYIGEVLISVNPYKEVPIYSQEYVRQYEGKHIIENPPHIFAITDRAYKSLIEENREQCILISGESGSGKTEASKKVIQYIAEVTGHRGEVEGVKNKLLQSTPILEAFGNARTNRNDNSSRFGKYMDIQFDFHGNPVGGDILNYLLEKSRIINRAKGERSFHIFYQLLNGASDDDLEKLHLKRDQNNYNYLNQPEAIEKVHNDKKSYFDICNALSSVDIDDFQKDEIFKIVASVLHLGNIEFIEAEESIASIKISDPTKYVAELLGCDYKTLVKSLTHRTREASVDVVVSPLDQETAVYARDALAKAMYDRLFSWLVKRLNRSLKYSGRKNNTVIGILDIYGFEIFQKNSFEQLCINYCNEKLHQLFIELTLKSEQEEYHREGIEWQNVEFFNNKIICDLIEVKHTGIIAIMDEECLRPGDVSDMTLLAKMDQNLQGHTHYLSHQRADIQLQKTMGRDEFKLIHYAGSVTYNIRTFMDKNQDLLFRDLREAMMTSSNTIISTVFSQKEQESKKLPTTAINKFKNSLNDLMEILMKKEPSYIRCIKPNDSKLSDLFDSKLVANQVTYLGLMENLRVRRAGFAFRRDYSKFLERYKSLASITWPNYHGPTRDGVELLLKSFGLTNEEYALGKTKIFIKYPRSLFEIEDAFQKKKHQIAAIIQSNYRGLVQRRKYIKTRLNIILIQCWVRRFLAQRQLERRKEAVVKIRRFIEGFITRNGPQTDINQRFIQLAKKQWLLRLPKELPTNVLQNYWPDCPGSCKEASEILRKLHKLHLARKYRNEISAERKHQFELKILAENLFSGKKKGYESTVPYCFKTERIPYEVEDSFKKFCATLNGEVPMYSTVATKFDRHKYKPRKRIMVITNQSIYLVEAKETSNSIKHKLPLSQVKFVVSNASDKLFMIKLPQELIVSDKGDIILEVPQIFECVTQAADIKNDRNCVEIQQDKIEHSFGKKQGVIEVKIGKPECIQRDEKTGHLIIITQA